MSLEEKLQALIESDEFKSKCKDKLNGATVDADNILAEFSKLYDDNAKTLISSDLGYKAVAGGGERWKIKSSVVKDGRVEITLQFQGIVERDSLNPNSEGLRSIVSLFETGYPVITKERPWGKWRGKHIKAKASWEAAGFVTKTLKDFENKYSEYNASAMVTNPEFVSAQSLKWS